ncbi:MAG TPA: hypothetical protein VIY08_02830 [Candidatus Nitrosocosmicus sp.]
MSYEIKNRTSLVSMIIVFTAIMIVGSIATSADNIVFGFRHHHNFHHFGHFGHFGPPGHFGHFGPPGYFPYQRSLIDQSIDQHSVQHQHAICLSAGAFSPISSSCNNVAQSANHNAGGNAGFADHSGNSRFGQSIDQSGIQHQHAICLSAGAFSPVTSSCNNVASHQNNNLGGNAAASTSE